MENGFPEPPKHYMAHMFLSVRMDPVIVDAVFVGLSWGQMGLSEYEQMKEQEQRLLLNGIRSSEESSAAYRSQDNFVSFCQSNGVGYCQENGDSACSQNTVLVEKRKNPDAIEVEAKLIADSNSTETAISKIKSGKETSRKVHSMTWLDGWEQEDTYAALAVACAAVSVVVAYKFYKVL
ncbi:hypothetical protein TanjilG_29693 [Lupinus angustifolius]|uniref:Uncharacterized protein n=1 Tax=Lupinus angustifolius TaxID=3871 RepID=A0A4P1R698_LUPAN|nr:hypothetical protein TanjilG_29693 [Lupinus angustifolius]